MDQGFMDFINNSTEISVEFKHNLQTYLNQFEDFQMKEEVENAQDGVFQTMYQQLMNESGKLVEKINGFKETEDLKLEVERLTQQNNAYRKERPFLKAQQVKVIRFNWERKNREQKMNELEEICKDLDRELMEAKETVRYQEQEVRRLRKVEYRFWEMENSCVEVVSGLEEMETMMTQRKILCCGKTKRNEKKELIKKMKQNLEANLKHQ